MNWILAAIPLAIAGAMIWLSWDDPDRFLNWDADRNEY